MVLQQHIFLNISDPFGMGHLGFRITAPDGSPKWVTYGSLIDHHKWVTCCCCCCCCRCRFLLLVLLVLLLALARHRGCQSLGGPSPRMLLLFLSLSFFVAGASGVVVGSC